MMENNNPFESQKELQAYHHLIIQREIYYIFFIIYMFLSLKEPSYHSKQKLDEDNEYKPSLSPSREKISTVFH